MPDEPSKADQQDADPSNTLEDAVRSSAETSDRQKNWNDLYRLECDLLGHDPEAKRTNGVCLSGGGVRSAVTCMGVLGCLARRNVLDHVHYVSSVSGGGYAASALSNWLHTRAETDNVLGDATASATSDAEVPAQPQKAALSQSLQSALKVPFVTLNNRSASALRQQVEEEGNTPAVPADNPIYSGRDLLAQNEAYIRHIRANISFLMPNGFSGALVGGYAVLRSVVLNIFVWLIFATLVFLLLINPSQAIAVLTTFPDVFNGPSTGLSAVNEALQSFAAHMNADLRPNAVFGWAFVVGVCLIGVLLFQMVGYSIATAFKSYIGKQTRVTRPNEQAGPLSFNYSWRRGNEWLARKLMLGSIVLIGVGVVPWLAANLSHIADLLDGSGTGGGAGALPSDTIEGAQGVSIIPGTLATLGGIASSLIVFVRTRLGKVIGPKSSALVILGSLLLVYGVAILAYGMALQIEDGAIPMSLATVVIALAFTLAWACNINDVSLGRFYRDRLIEAFMPDLETIWDRRPGAKLVKIAPPAVKADQLRVTDLRGEKSCIKPLHLVNTNVITWWTNDTRAQRRKGDNFVVSAVGTGSDTTGWRMTSDVADGKLTLATAMAASGAAVNPNGGFSGAGPTTLLPVSLAMSLLSLRLGYWLRWRMPKPFLFRFNRFGNRLNPPALQFFANLTGLVLSRDRTPNFIELTDGGHFENLGLYELIRRRCRIIIICDAGEDPQTSYSGFTSAIRRVREDFGAEIHFDVERDLAP
ncbi:MAG: hypothetical protein AB8B58_14095, partial [Roseobacter sp.]